MGGCSLEQEGGNFYIVGADSVRKKLTGNDIYEIAYNEGNGWAGKETIQLDVTNIPDYAAFMSASSSTPISLYLIAIPDRVPAKLSSDSAGT